MLAENQWQRWQKMYEYPAFREEELHDDLVEASVTLTINRLTYLILFRTPSSGDKTTSTARRGDLGNDYYNQLSIRGPPYPILHSASAKGVLLYLHRSTYRRMISSPSDQIIHHLCLKPQFPPDPALSIHTFSIALERHPTQKK